jgi:NAD+ synthase (glutamine-hydrolysing)
LSNRCPSVFRKARRAGGPASDLAVFELDGVRFGLALSFDDLDDFDTYDFDLDVLLYLDSCGFVLDDPSSGMGMAITESRFIDDAEATGAWIVGVGSLGTYGEQVCIGGSFVLTSWGELAAQAASFDEDFLVADVNPDYGGPLDHPLAPEVFDRPLVGWNALVQGLSETIDQMGFTQAAVLVDGTLGSSAVATLVTDALGPTNVHALLVTGANDRLDASARKLVENLRLPVRELPMAALSPDRALAADLAKAHLAALAREEGAMPLSNLDKTAMALEIMPGMLAPAGLAPLGDVYRSTVLDLVHTRNTISPVISRDSCRAFEVPAIPGVEECGPTPEQRLGFVDYVLASHIEWARALSDIADIEGHPQVVSAILDRLATCQPGRMSCCLVIVMSTCTLDDAPWPLGMAWRDRPRTKEERAGKLDGKCGLAWRRRGRGNCQALLGGYGGRAPDASGRGGTQGLLRRSAIPSRTCAGSSTSSETSRSRAGLPPTSRRAVAEGTARAVAQAAVECLVRLRLAHLLGELRMPFPWARGMLE